MSKFLQSLLILPDFIDGVNTPQIYRFGDFMPHQNNNCSTQHKLHTVVSSLHEDGVVRFIQLNHSTICLGTRTALSHQTPL